MPGMLSALGDTQGPGLSGLVFPYFSLPWKGTNDSALFTPATEAGCTLSRVFQVFLFPSSTEENR